MTTKDEIGTMLNDCEKRESKLSDWERQFIDSISNRFYKSGGLSPAQTEVLERIWDKVTS